MAKKTVSKKEIALPLKWYEGEDPTPDELALYAEVYKSIGAIRQNLLIKQPFIGNVLLNLDLVLDLTIPTAATDFRNIYVNPKFWLLLDKGERLFTLAHETWHVALNHVLRRQGRLPEIWNIACDLEIHFVLLTEKFNEPWCLQHDPAWSTYSAEKIYDELMKNQPPRGGNGKDPNGNDDGNGNAPICVNPIPGGNQGTQNDKFGPTDRPFDGVIYDDPKPDGNDSDKDGNGNSVQRQGEWKPASEEPEKIDDFVRRIVNQAVIITQKNHGSVPGAVSGVIDEINNPVIPWREVLDAWATRVVDEWGHNTYKRLNRRTWSCGGQGLWRFQAGGRGSGV